jgi:hypothetical protein
MTARFLLLANSLGVAIYILWQGVEKFWWESFGTWMISPLIYVRICPEAFKPSMLALANSGWVANAIFCGIPLVMFVVALIAGSVAFWNKSLRLAAIACFLMSSIFLVYHSIKHLGMTFQVI